MLQISPQSLASLLAEAYEAGVMAGLTGSARPADEVFLEYEEIWEAVSDESSRH